MKIKIAVVSPKSAIEDTFFHKSSINYDLDFKRSYVLNNKEPLTKVYNKILKESYNEKVDILIFVHDDVYINCRDFILRVKDAAQKYTVFGLAGTSSLTIKEPALWHLMGTRETLKGCVAHGLTKENYVYTSFGPLNEQVLMIDGVFIGINLNTLPKNITFDENIPSRFHYYDLVFSFDCSLDKLKVGVVDIPIIHNSPGLRDMNQEWKDGQAYFLKKYEKFKGKTLTV